MYKLVGTFKDIRYISGVASIEAPITTGWRNIYKIGQSGYRICE